MSWISARKTKSNLLKCFQLCCGLGISLSPLLNMIIMSLLMKMKVINTIFFATECKRKSTWFSSTNHAVELKFNTI